VILHQGSLPTKGFNKALRRKIRKYSKNSIDYQLTQLCNFCCFHGKIFWVHEIEPNLASIVFSDNKYFLQPKKISFFVLAEELGKTSRNT